MTATHAEFCRRLLSPASAHPKPPLHPVVRIRRASAGPAIALLCAGLGACSLAPVETEHEQAKLEAAGKPFEPPIEERSLPELPPSPSWQDVLQRTFLANGELEASYFRWKGAMERAAAAGAYPNTDVSLGYSYMFSGGKMKALDRSTFSVGFDASKNLVLPVKVKQAALVALDEARVTGDEFRVKMFDLQRTALSAWAEYKKQGSMIEYRMEIVALARIDAELARARAYGAGGADMPGEIVRSELALRQAESAVLDAEAERRMTLATLNGMMGREATAPLGTPANEELPPLPEDDAALLAGAADIFPEVVRFADEVKGRRDALELARLRWVPDISPSLMFTGNVSQALGAMVTLPTTIVEIRASIRAAEAGVREGEATLRQKRTDRASEFVSLLITARNAARQRELLERAIVPAAEQLAAIRSRAYAAGGASLVGVLEARRMQIEAHEATAEARAVYEKSLVDIACCLGVGLDEIGHPASPPARDPNPDHDAHHETRMTAPNPENRP